MTHCVIFRHKYYNYSSSQPLILGFIGECSKQSSNADYVHTFDPVLRMDSSNGQNGKTEVNFPVLEIAVDG